MSRLPVLLAVLLLLAGRAFAAPPPGIVAAENFYGDVARQIGGPDVAVRSILSNPDQDPHLFEVSPSVARAVAGARIVIYNGLDYDPWMASLLRAAGGTQRQTVVAASLVAHPIGNNPHIWYEPATMAAVAAHLAGMLAAADPAHAAGYRERLAQFTASLQPIEAKIAALRQRLHGAPVTATEPVCGYLFAALGLQVRGLPFQMAVMNNTEPGAADVAAFERDLRTHRVRLLVYNSQASDPMAARMRDIARAAHVPVIGATETEPPGQDYQQWLTGLLDAIDRALPE
jgi:zinc/manganese transport system substrate-binding protein